MVPVTTHGQRADQSPAAQLGAWRLVVQVFAHSQCPLLQLTSASLRAKAAATVRCAVADGQGFWLSPA